MELSTDVMGLSMLFTVVLNSGLWMGIINSPGYDPVTSVLSGHCCNLNSGARHDAGGTCTVFMTICQKQNTK